MARKIAKDLTLHTITVQDLKGLTLHEMGHVLSVIHNRIDRLSQYLTTDHIEKQRERLNNNRSVVQSYMKQRHSNTNSLERQIK